MKRNRLKISIITPAYNAEEYIGRTIESIQTQTFSSYEHIIIDDGSSDKTRTIVESYAKDDSRIHFIRQANQGASVARNKGIELASGDYVTFVDGDDFVAEDMLEVLYNAATSRDADLICFNKYIYRDVSQEALQETWLYKTGILPQVFNPRRDISAFTFIFAPLSICTFLKRNFIEEHGLRFSERYRRNEDILFVTQAMVLANRASYIKRELYYYRVGVGGNMSSTLDKHRDDGWMVMEDLYNFLVANRLFTGNVKRSFNILCHAILWHYVSNMGTYEGQKYAFNKVKHVARRLQLDKMKDPGDIYTDINFYKEFRAIISETYDEYLWDRAQKSIQYENKLIDRINSLDSTISQQNIVISQQNAELDGLRNSFSWKITGPLRYIKNNIIRKERGSD